MDSASRPDRVRLGVGGCLRGEAVGDDGGHRLDQYVVGTLGRCVEWVPVCPELEMGVGAPREALRPVGGPAAPRLVTLKGGWTTPPACCGGRGSGLPGSGSSISTALSSRASPADWAGWSASASTRGPACRRGRSPASSPGPSWRPAPAGRGGGRFRDPWLRESFIVHIFTHHHWRQLAGGSLRPGPPCGRSGRPGADRSPAASETDDASTTARGHDRRPVAGRSRPAPVAEGDPR